MQSIECYQNKLGLVFDVNYNLGDALVWKCMSRGEVKCIYSCLVDNDVPLKCIDKWSHMLNTQVNTNTIFSHIRKVTNDTHLRWFQYRLIYRILPTQHFLFLRRIVNSESCTFCGYMYESIEHLFWDCVITHDFWADFLTWLHTNFQHCSNLRLSKELIITGCETKVFSDRIVDLFILLAKYHIFSSKTKSAVPHIQVFIRIVKQRYNVEKINSYTNNSSAKFRSDWCMYSHV